MTNMNQIYGVTLALLLSHCFPYDSHAAFTAFTTSLGHSYLLSDTATTFSAASSDCVTQGSDMATYDNIRFQDVVDFLSANSPSYDAYQIWVPVTKTSGWPSQYFFSGGGDQVAADKWYTTEPDLNCGSTCCYRMVLEAAFGQHKLRDHYCSQTYNYICLDTSTTTTASTSTTTIATTSTTLITETTTTAETTSTTASTTLEISTPTTSTTDETTSATTSTTLDTSSSPTISTTDETTSTMTSATSDMTTPTAATTFRFTLAKPISIDSPKVPLSVGEQMSILYIGFIVGGSLVLSCCCSTAWLVIFRTHSRFKNKATDEETLEKNDTGDSSDCSSDEELSDEN